VPVVVLTSSAEPREVAQCYQAGANSCIRKPIEFREFAEALRTTGRYWLELNRAAASGDTIRAPAPS
jgi:two-component system response regulator